MIDLSTDQAVAVVAAAVALAAVWGAALSIRSIIRGPGWAQTSLRHSVAGGGGVVAAGLISVLFVSPIWVGLAVVYIGAVIAWLSWVVWRSLRRATALGVSDPLPDDRKADVLDRLARGLLGGGVVLAVVGIWYSGSAAWFIGLLGVLAAALLIPGAVAHREARRLRG